MVKVINLVNLLKKNNVTIIKYFLVNAKEFLIKIIKMTEIDALDYIEKSALIIKYKDEYFFSIFSASVLVDELGDNETKKKIDDKLPLKKSTNYDNKIHEFKWNDKRLKVVKNKTGMYLNKKDIFNILEIDITSKVPNKLLKGDEKKLGDLISIENKESKDDYYIFCLDLFTLLQFSEIESQNKLIKFIMYHVQFEINNADHFYDMLQTKILYDCSHENKKGLCVMDYFNKSIAYVANVSKNQIVINHTDDILEELKLKTKIYKKFNLFFIRESSDPEKLVEILRNNVPILNK